MVLGQVCQSLPLRTSSKHSDQGLITEEQVRHTHTLKRELNGISFTLVCKDSLTPSEYLLEQNTSKTHNPS